MHVIRSEFDLKSVVVRCKIVMNHRLQGRVGVNTEIVEVLLFCKEHDAK